MSLLVPMTTINLKIDILTKPKIIIPSKVHLPLENAL